MSRFLAVGLCRIPNLLKMSRWLFWVAVVIRAGYQCPQKAAEAASSRLLRNVKVKAAIADALQERAKNSMATIERLEQELERIAPSS